MSALSGFDSEVVGFESVAPIKKSGIEISTQTCEFSECGVASQTVLSKDIGCMAAPGELNADDGVPKEYPPSGLNDFLRRVVPGMMEQLEQNDKEMLYNSSDSEDEEPVAAKLLQEMKVEGDGLGAGDHRSSILSVTWSSAGNSLALSIGQTQHETWCQNPGLIKVYTTKRSEGDKLVHMLDISEKNCVTVLKYHPTVAALLAYGTTSGEVVLCNLTNPSSNCYDEGLTSPSGCHGSRRVSALYWADATLANTFLTMQINCKGRRRGASDQILISSGSDGTINVWQVNANLKIFENVVCYTLNAGKNAPDITCFDFIKSFPLRGYDERILADVFAVGTKSGRLYLCKIKAHEEGEVDPVYQVLEGHSSCVLEVAFSYQKPGTFVSVSMDSELRVYNINQPGPLKIFCLDVAISCMSWLGHVPCVVLGLTDSEKEALRGYNVSSGKVVPIEGLLGGGCVTCVAVSQSGSCKIAAGDSDHTLRVWELPARRIKFTSDSLDL
ncbi:unnamed protein product [Parnassius mnemosyne]|uniref:WD repeat-containing protein 34 n=1 Tax=Parnassius mnemosyne TaxID=213953 RepID=A0AAV1L0V5_9NEOP